MCVACVFHVCGVQCVVCVLHVCCTVCGVCVAHARVFRTCCLASHHRHAVPGMHCNRRLACWAPVSSRSTQGRLQSDTLYFFLTQEKMCSLRITLSSFSPPQEWSLLKLASLCLHHIPPEAHAPPLESETGGEVVTKLFLIFY